MRPLAPPPCLSLIAAEARELFWPWGLALALAALALGALTDFLAPPFWFAERGLLASAQLSSSLLVVAFLLLVRWSLARQEFLGEGWLPRFDSRLWIPVGEACGLLAGLAGVATAAAVLYITVQRNIEMDAWLGAGMSVAGLAAIAPGLSRLPVSRPQLVLLWSVVGAGQLGFLGSWFPLRTDRVWSQLPDADPSARWAADLLACLGGMALSVALARGRRGSRRSQTNETVGRLGEPS